MLFVSDSKKKLFFIEKSKLRSERQEILKRIEENMEVKKVDLVGGDDSYDDNYDVSNDSNSKSMLLDAVSEEEEKAGEIVKCALQIIGNLAFGCTEVQVFVYTRIYVWIRAKRYIRRYY